MNVIPPKKKKKAKISDMPSSRFGGWWWLRGASLFTGPPGRIRPQKRVSGPKFLQFFKTENSLRPTAPHKRWRGKKSTPTPPP